VRLWLGGGSDLSRELSAAEIAALAAEEEWEAASAHDFADALLEQNEQASADRAPEAGVRRRASRSPSRRNSGQPSAAKPKRELLRRASSRRFSAANANAATDAGATLLARLPLAYNTSLANGEAVPLTTEQRAANAWRAAAERSEEDGGGGGGRRRGSKSGAAAAGALRTSHQSLPTPPARLYGDGRTDGTLSDDEVRQSWQATLRWRTSPYAPSEGCDEDDDLDALAEHAAAQPLCGGGGGGGDGNEAFVIWELPGREWRAPPQLQLSMLPQRAKGGRLRALRACMPSFLHEPGRRGEPVYYEMCGAVDLDRLREMGATVEEALSHYAAFCEFCWVYLASRDPLLHGEGGAGAGAGAGSGAGGGAGAAAGADAGGRSGGGDGLGAGGAWGRCINVMDVANVGMRSLMLGGVMDYLRRVTAVASTHYANRARISLVVNAPWWFQRLWVMVRPLLAPSVAEQTHVFTVADEGKMHEMLFRLVEPAHVPSRYGGSSPTPLGKSRAENIFTHLCGGVETAPPPPPGVRGS
jgi:hypothetical protein